MNLDDASLSDLVAELLKRLRHLTNGAVDPDGQAGPLDPGGRAALASRLLAVVLADRPDPPARDAARALGELADALAGARAPLPGSVWEADLTRLARQFEELAAAWDQDDPAALQEAWTRLRQLGDHLWTTTPSPVPTPPRPVSTTTSSPAPTPAAPAAASAAAPPAAEAAGRDQVILLVSGALRRRTLQHRLAEAGLRVICPADAAAAAAALASVDPLAVICDDAAPDRHGTRLRELLPEPAPPLVLVRARAGQGPAADAAWLPPYRVEELLARLQG